MKRSYLGHNGQKWEKSEGALFSQTFKVEEYNEPSVFSFNILYEMWPTGKKSVTLMLDKTLFCLFYLFTDNYQNKPLI